MCDFKTLTWENVVFGSATTNPIRALGRLRQIKMCFIWYGKPVKCMQTTLLLSAADLLLNKLGEVEELWINISDKQIKCCSLKWFYLHYQSKVISFR